MSGEHLNVTGVRKGFGTVEVLKDVNLDIEPGRFLTLLGPSGCGKSTLLRLIAGFETLDEGDIQIGQRSLKGLPPKKRNVAMVFQSYALYPHMTVRRNIEIPLMMERLSFVQRLPVIGRFIGKASEIWSGIGRDVDAVSSQLEIGQLLERKPAQLSGGQRQRVAVGRAMVRQPAVFLMDEPLSNLDAKLRVQLREEISDLHRRTGITFVYVTHDQTEAMSMSDYIALMDSGRIAQFGTPAQIYNEPQRLSVARFVGSTTINVLPVSISGNGRLMVGEKELGVSVRALPREPVHMGIRPESLQILNPDDAKVQIVLPLSKVERLGSEIILHFDGRSLGADKLRMQVRADIFDGARASGWVGDEVSLGIALNGIHLFDENEERIPSDLIGANTPEGRANVV